MITGAALALTLTVAQLNAHVTEMFNTQGLVPITVDCIDSGYCRVETLYYTANLRCDDDVCTVVTVSD